METTKKATKWMILFFYWAFLTKALIAPHPTDLVGGETKVTWLFNPSASLPSFLLHLFSYALLAALIVWVTKEKWKSVVLWLALAITHGIVFEYVQYYVPFRWPYWLDAFANCLGVLAVACLYYATIRRIRLPLPETQIEPAIKTGTHG